MLEKRRDPKGCDPEVGKIVELVDNALEIAAPIFAPVLARGIVQILALSPVIGIAIMKTVQNNKINGFAAEIDVR